MKDCRSAQRILCLCVLFLTLSLLQPLSQLPLDSFETPSPPPNTIELAQDVGDTRSFWTFNFDIETYYKIDATLLAIGEYCLIYFQDSLIFQLSEEEASSRSESYRNEFDDVIYPAVTELTGDPNGRIGDIDGNPRIVILISDNLISYYAQDNEIVSTYSNLCEMIYIYYNNNLILDTIAHEFCHLIWFNYEFDEVHFVLEGMAEYATFYIGYLAHRYNMSYRTDDFLQTPDDSLIYFDVAQKDYGGSYLFLFYLAERFGVQFLTDLVQQEEDGALGIETALLEAGYNISFNELYLDWVTALTIDEPSFAENQYGLQNMDFQFQDYTLVDVLPFGIESLPIRYYGSEIFRITNPVDNFSVEISQPSLGLAGVSIVYHDLDGWHVQKNTLGNNVMENVTGKSIDTAYVITSLMFNEAPAGNIDFGEGFSNEVDIKITAFHIGPNPRINPLVAEILTIPLVVSLFTASILLISGLAKYKQNNTV